MRINQLQVQNFRCFEDQSWSFAPGFNVLIGDNGAGKSAVLDALAIALDPVIYKASGMPARAIRPDDVRLSLGEPQFPVEVEAQGAYADKEQTWKRTLSEKPNAKTSNALTKKVRSGAELLFKHMRNGEPTTAPVISYYTTGRLWRQKREKLENTVSPGSKLRGYDYALDAEANDHFLLSWFKTMALGSLQSAQEKNGLSNRSHEGVQSFEAVRHAISQCMEGNRKFFTFDIPQNTIMVADESGEDRVPFRMLSDGQRSVAALIMDLGYRCATLNPHLGLKALAETPGVVLIDEIDLHLHPKWQRCIVKNLREVFPKVQFFATTHSPLIIQSLLPGEVIDLNGGEPRDYFRQSVEEILTDEMGMEEVRRNATYVDMVKTAKEYYDLLEKIDNPDSQEVEDLQKNLIT